MAYSAEFTQVGNKGTTVVETSFGLDFRADYIIDPKLKKTAYGRRKEWGVTRRFRVIRVMSVCCSATYDRANDNPKAPISCHACRALPPWPDEMLDFSLSEDYTLGQRQLEALVEQVMDNVLEASLAASGLFHALGDLFGAIERGERLRSLVTLHPSAEV